MTLPLKTKLTPLAKLQHKKEQIQLESTLQEQKLNEHFSYMKEHASSLFFSGLSSFLFPGSKTSSAKGNSELSPTTAEHANSPLGILNYLSIGKGLLPIAWEIAQPFMITWGIKSVRNFFTNLFSKKKSK